jgi:putative transposase
MRTPNSSGFGRCNVGKCDAQRERSEKVVTLAAKRQAEGHLQVALAVSEHRARDVLDVDRTMVRYASRLPGDEKIRERMQGLAAWRRRFGHRRLHWLLGREGH